MKFGQGYIFTGICDSVHRGVLSQHALQVVSQHALQGGAIPACIAGGIPACLAGGQVWGGLLWQGVPGLGGSAPRGVPDGDPPGNYCCRQYASYWNAFLLKYICLTSLTCIKCSAHATLCWKIGNISGSTELFGL